MKKVIIAVSAVLVAASLYATDTKTTADAKDKTPCSDKTKMSASADAKGACCDKDKAASNEKASGGCCGEAKSACSKTPSRRIAMSPKAAAQVAN